jgi:hypothetical protein
MGLLDHVDTSFHSSLLCLVLCQFFLGDEVTTAYWVMVTQNHLPFLVC